MPRRKVCSEPDNYRCEEGDETRSPSSRRFRELEPLLHYFETDL
jgi:hypothetical protein